VGEEETTTPADADPPEESAPDEPWQDPGKEEWRGREDWRDPGKTGLGGQAPDDDTIRGG
jgi:hypothetical protein